MARWSILIVDLQTGKAYETGLKVSRGKAFHVAAAWPHYRQKLLPIAIPRKWIDRFVSALQG